MDSSQQSSHDPRGGLSAGRVCRAFGAALGRFALMLTVKIIANDKGNPVGKLADAERHFTDGPLGGLKLIGFNVWETRSGARQNVTFPARQYHVNGSADRSRSSGPSLTPRRRSASATCCLRPSPNLSTSSPGPHDYDSRSVHRGALRFFSTFRALHFAGPQRRIIINIRKHCHAAINASSAEFVGSWSPPRESACGRSCALRKLPKTFQIGPQGGRPERNRG